VNAPLSFANIGAQGWTLGWQDSLRIVQVVAAGGLDRNWAQVIGKAWDERRVTNPTGDWFTPEETLAIKSGEDTVRKAVNLAYWNFHGQWAPTVDQAAKDSWQIPSYRADKPAGREAFDVPDAPRPPAAIAVRARMVDWGMGYNELRWSTEAETDPDHDTGVLDFSRYRIYRQDGSRLAPWKILSEMPAGDLAMAEVGEHGVDFAGRLYADLDVIEGVDYWYAVVAVDDGSQNWAEPGVPLESSRWWTWTGYSEAGVTALAPVNDCQMIPPWHPSSCTDDVNQSAPVPFALHPAAPNPFNPSTTLRCSLPDAEQARLTIWSTTGQLVRTLVDGHVDAGHHSVTWNGTDGAGRAVASGVYLVRLESADAGKADVRRITLVR